MNLLLFVKSLLYNDCLSTSTLLEIKAQTKWQYVEPIFLYKDKKTFEGILGDQHHYHRSTFEKEQCELYLHIFKMPQKKIMNSKMACKTFFCWLKYEMNKNEKDLPCAAV